MSVAHQSIGPTTEYPKAISNRYTPDTIRESVDMALGLISALGSLHQRALQLWIRGQDSRPSDIVPEDIAEILAPGSGKPLVFAAMILFGKDERPIFKTTVIHAYRAITGKHLGHHAPLAVSTHMGTTWKEEFDVPTAEETTPVLPSPETPDPITLRSKYLGEITLVSFNSYSSTFLLQEFCKAEELYGTWEPNLRKRILRWLHRLNTDAGARLPVGADTWGKTFQAKPLLFTIFCLLLLKQESKTTMLRSVISRAYTKLTGTKHNARLTTNLGKVMEVPFTEYDITRNLRSVGISPRPNAPVPASTEKYGLHEATGSIFVPTPIDLGSGEDDNGNEFAQMLQDKADLEGIVREMRRLGIRDFTLTDQGMVIKTEAPAPPPITIVFK